MNTQGPSAQSGRGENESAETRRCGLSELPPPDQTDPVLEVYQRDVDRTLLRRNLALTPAERAKKLVDFVRFLEELRRGVQKAQVKSQ